ncbi:MAG: Gfo/Idh/MocA family oxidoreductase, partial [Planctomycetales bacterium]|nr:Gfo/Idh/MocA family oxidoreductase [Planctomycetales bacterium]
MSASQQSKLSRLAVIGCGAAAKEFFLPALQRYSGYQDLVTVIDRTQEQAESVARSFGIKQFGTDYRDVVDHVDAAIIATPHTLHAEQALHFLESGKHVLVEKPIGMNPDEVSRMLAASAVNEALLTVNNYRRLFPAYRRVHEMLESRQLGEIRAITIHDGTKFAWQSVSSFYVRDPQARGVLLDRGAHTVDVLGWWLGERPRVVSAELDSIGQVEGLVNLQLSCRDVSISLKFSRFQRLENVYKIECDN